MGILESIKSVVGNKADDLLGEEGPLGAVTGLVGQGGEQLSNLLDKFRDGGFGDMVQSWIGKDEDNQPISADQVKSALGDDALSGVANKLGVSTDEAASKVAESLPDVVDKLTPDGEVPDKDTLAETIGGLSKR